MSMTEAIFFGAIQGMTGFFPLSGSGHLLILRELFNLKPHPPVFNLILQAGMFFAILTFFFKETLRVSHDTFWFFLQFPFKRKLDMLYREYPFASVGIYVLLATIVTGLIGVAFKRELEMFLGSVTVAGIGWMMTGMFLLFSRHFYHGNREMLDMNHQDAFVVGLIQGLSIIPGVSRSGVTIVGGMMMGLEREVAVRFSFWIALPVILGAGIMEMDQTAELLKAGFEVAATGFFATFLTGLICLGVLMKMIQSQKFHCFGYYCLLAGVVVLVSSLMKGILS